MKRLKWVFITFSLIAFQSILSTSFSQIQVICPLPNDTVLNGEVFIVCRIDTAFHMNPKTLRFYFEGVDISSLIKINGNMVTVLMMQKFKPYKYTFRLQFRDKSGELWRKDWSFFVVNKNNIPNKKNDQKDSTVKKEKAYFKGSLNTTTRFSFVNNDGDSLRQEPAQTHELRLNGFIGYKKMKVPLKLCMTNHENFKSPYRDRFMTGILFPKNGIEFGTVSPCYDKLVLNGTSLQGIRAYTTLSSTEFHLVYGYLNRKIEGTKEKFADSLNFPPTNMKSDSTYIREGIYRRNLIAANLVFHGIDESRFYIMFLKSTDDTNSIIYGGPAAQNFVFGSGTTSRSRKNRIQYDIGVALSVTTSDIRRGVYSKDMVKKMFNLDIPFEPEKIKRIIIINGTTTPMTWGNMPPLAYYGNATINLFKQNFNFHYQRIGSAFQSFGNPYLVNDKKEVSIEDRFSLLKKRLQVSLQYTNYGSNLSNTSLTDKNTHIGSASASYKSLKKLPSVFVSARYYLRNEKFSANDSVYQKIEVVNLLGGANYTLKTGILSHNLGLTYNYYLRGTNLSGIPKNTSTNLNFFLNENLPNRFSINASFSSFILSDDTSDLNIMHTYGFSAGWSSKKGNVKVRLNYTGYSTAQTEMTRPSTRQMVNFDFAYKVFKKVEISLNSGTGLFKEKITSGNKYNEFWVLLSLNYSTY